MERRIKDLLQENVALVRSVMEGPLGPVADVIDVLIRAFRNGNKVLIFGNGGSASDAQHIAAEFVNRFIISRPAPARSGSDHGHVDTDERRQRRQLRCDLRKTDPCVGRARGRRLGDQHERNFPERDPRAGSGQGKSNDDRRTDGGEGCRCR